jgi:ABC-type phosphate transport system substrate-binding protein
MRSITRKIACTLSTCCPHGLLGLSLLGLLIDARWSLGQEATAGGFAALASFSYRPEQSVEGNLRVGGSSTMQQASAYVMESFTAIHPAVNGQIASSTSEEGWQGLLRGEFDVALMSRPLEGAEIEAAEKQLGKRVWLIPIAFDQLVWVVHPSNPIAELAWSPEHGILRPTGDDAVEATGQAQAGSSPLAASTASTASSAASAATPVADWSRLSSVDAWKAVPLVVHATELGSGTRWHLDHLLDGKTTSTWNLREHANLAAVGEAVAADQGGLGLVSDAHSQWPGVRKLPFVVPAAFSPATDAVRGSERTPDYRPLFMVLATPMEGEWPALYRELVAYILSYSGQLDMVKDGLEPLTRAEIYAQQERLGWSVER